MNTYLQAWIYSMYIGMTAIVIYTFLVQIKRRLK